MNTNHLYIHIPFCSQICKFCDFKRIKSNNFKKMSEYVDKIINQVSLTSFKNQYKTIYIGGGTPNFLPYEVLKKLLSFLKDYLKNDYEFTIECNPDLITIEQAKLFFENNVNRISLGVQSTNNLILKQMNRTHTIQDVQNAIKILKRNQIKNISCDFIYNLPNESKDDLLNIFKFISNNQIEHVSIYSLEMKANSILTKSKHKINNEIEEDKLELIKHNMKKLGYERYEVSNWTKNNKYSKHNLAYWNSESWKGIGYGAYGFEYGCIYEIGNNIDNFKVISTNMLSNQDYYFQILMMGLRLTKGINLNIQKNYLAYKFFENKFKNIEIINNWLIYKDIDTLDDLLIDLL